MARPDRYLADGEELVLGVRPHGRVLLWPFLFLLVVAAGGGAVVGATRGQQSQAELDVLLLVVGGVLVLWWVVRPFALWWTTEYVLTTRQVLLVRGLFARTARHLPLHRVDSLSVDRDVADRLLGCGTLTVRPTGDALPLVLLDVPQVRAVERVLSQLLDGWAAGEFEDEDEDAEGYDDDYDEYEAELDEVDLTGLGSGTDLDVGAGAPARRSRWRRR